MISGLVVEESMKTRYLVVIQCVGGFFIKLIDVSVGYADSAYYLYWWHVATLDLK
jgi:hypothetical protein